MILYCQPFITGGTCKIPLQGNKAIVEQVIFMQQYMTVFSRNIRP